MKIGPITIPEAGERATGSFTFSDDEGLAKYEWPYVAIAGLRAGPTFLITAGIHAAEYTGIEAAIRLGRTISPDAVRGTILILPLLNRPAQRDLGSHVRVRAHEQAWVLAHDLVRRVSGLRSEGGVDEDDAGLTGNVVLGDDDGVAGVDDRRLEEPDALVDLLSPHRSEYAELTLLTPMARTG